MVSPGCDQCAGACDGWVGTVQLDGDVDARIGHRLVTVQAGSDRLIGVIEPRPYCPSDEDDRQHDDEDDPRCAARAGVAIRDALAGLVSERMVRGWHVAHCALGRRLSA